METVEAVGLGLAVRNTGFRGELVRMRMERATELLRAGWCRVKEVAAAVGYRNATQFSKAFRRQHGVTPSSFQDGADAHRASAA